VRAQVGGDLQIDGRVTNEWMLLKAGLVVGQKVRVAFWLGGWRRSMAAVCSACTRAWGLTQ
jgi:hypothetical protein